MKKICSKCKIEKPKSEFRPRPERPCGVQSHCKSCDKKHRKEWEHKYKQNFKSLNLKSKVCNTCKIEKHASDFYNRSDRPGGLNNKCKSCAKEWNRSNGYRAQKKQMSAYQKTSIFKQKRREKTINNYGITKEYYDYLIKLQNNSCAICKKHRSEMKSSFHIDHDHNTNKVRGLLCSNCNVAIGMLKDSTANLLSAVEYLNFYKENKPCQSSSQ